MAGGHPLDPGASTRPSVYVATTVAGATHSCNGAGREVTLRANESAYSDLIIRPRFLARDVSSVDLKTVLLGRTLAAPIAIAPTAMHALAHPDGELATARAAAATGELSTLSTMSTIRMEDVAAESRKSRGSPLWFQLYVGRKRDIPANLIRRAEPACLVSIEKGNRIPVLQ